MRKNKLICYRSYKDNSNKIQRLFFYEQKITNKYESFHHWSNLIRTTTIFFASLLEIVNSKPTKSP